MKTGVAISTFSSEKTSLKRIDILKESIESAIKKKTDSQISEVVVVNDCSLNEEHVKYLESIKNKVTLVNFSKNLGISSAKNASIKTLYDLGCNLMFIMDDDIVLNDNFKTFYQDAIIKTKIHHFCYRVPELNKSIISKTNIGGVNVIKTAQVNGAFFTLTKQLVDRVGYFKLLPYKYGHEHTEYTGRIMRMTNLCPGYVDVENSDKYIKYIGLDDRSDNFVAVNHPLIKENAKVAFTKTSERVEYKLKS